MIIDNQSMKEPEFCPTSYSAGDKHVEWPRNSTKFALKLSLFDIIQGIAKGVRYLHTESVLHMDLKAKRYPVRQRHVS